jgi:exportin-1
MSQAASNVDVLANPENVKIMSNILKTNVSACTSIGSFFLPQLGRIWLDMLGLYKAVSGIISEQVATQGKPRLPRARDVADVQDWSLPRLQKSVHYVRSRRRF